MSTSCIAIANSDWRDDYWVKLADYEAFGIQEYWIAEQQQHYLELGGRRCIESPKQPTFTVCSWVDGEYEMHQFRASDRIVSSTFLAFDLTVDQVF